MTDEKLLAVYKRLNHDAVARYIALSKKYDKLCEEKENFRKKFVNAELRVKDLEEQHENDELAIEYYKRAECPFYQHEGKCIDEVKKSDLKPINETQFRRKRNGG